MRYAIFSWCYNSKTSRSAQKLMELTQQMAVDYALTGRLLLLEEGAMLMMQGEELPLPLQSVSNFKKFLNFTGDLHYLGHADIEAVLFKTFLVFDLSPQDEQKFIKMTHLVNFQELAEHPFAEVFHWLASYKDHQDASANDAKMNLWKKVLFGLLLDEKSVLFELIGK